MDQLGVTEGTSFSQLLYEVEHDVVALRVNDHQPQIFNYTNTNSCSSLYSATDLKSPKMLCFGDFQNKDSNILQIGFPEISISRPPQKSGVTCSDSSSVSSTSTKATSSSSKSNHVSIQNSICNHYIVVVVLVMDDCGFVSRRSETGWRKKRSNVQRRTLRPIREALRSRKRTSPLLERFVIQPTIANLQSFFIMNYLGFFLSEKREARRKNLSSATTRVTLRKGTIFFIKTKLFSFLTATQNANISTLSKLANIP